MHKEAQTAVWGPNAQQWSRVGPPLKPSPEDGALTLSALTPFVNHTSPTGRVVVLGVTPELIQLPWPAGVTLLAFDHSAPMIEQVWRPHPIVRSSVHQADWAALPLESGSVMAVVGDGSLNALPSLVNYADVLSELHRVMAPQSPLVVRCFLRPSTPETLDEVIAAVNRGTVGSFHALKWRLAMILATVPGATVAIADIHSTFEASFPSRAELARLTGWPPAQIDTIDSYRGSATRYNFPTRDELTAQAAPYFDVTQVQHGSYELAGRCPTLTLVRRGATGARA